MANQYQIANLPTLLEKMTSVDKDFRFMATNDLMTELQIDSIKLDDDSERKIVKTLLKLLEDKNGEVQNLAVKCLGPLVSKVKEIQVETIVDTLCTNMLSEKEQLKDISSIGLKTVISQLPITQTQMSSSIVKKITIRLLNTIQKDDVSVQLETLDILADILNHFGGNLVSFHPQIFSCLIIQLNSQRLAVRKRAILAISYLVASCNSVLFGELLQVLLNELKKMQTNSLNKTYIQCLSSICRQAGHRVGENLQNIIPLIVFYCQCKDEELVEYSLQAFESFVRRCPKEITSYIKEIMNLCLKFISYDPNYNYDDEEDNESNDDNLMQQDDMDNDDDQEDYSDDDDVSWKIRRAAAKCLDAIIITRHEMLNVFYSEVSPILISRFKEREETVKGDIFNVYISILQQTRPLILKTKPVVLLNDNLGLQNNSNNKIDSDEASVLLLKTQINSVVKSIQKLLRNKNAKTRQGCFSLLTQLVNVLSGALNDHLAQIIPGISYSLNDKTSTSNMKIDTLNFLNNLLSTHDHKLFHLYIESIVPPVIRCIQDSFYKIASDALLVSQQLSKILRSATNSNINCMSHINDLYKATLARLKQTDIDQEVKERAIVCIAQMICSLGDLISNDLQTCWPILVERLKNEITRLTTVKAIYTIAESQSKVQLYTIFPEALPLLASFLRKNYRTLKLASINSLLSIYKNYGTHVNIEQLKSIIIVELPALLSENDLHISYVALKLATLICKQHGPSLIASHILNQVLVLIQSPLLQGLALESTIEFFISIVNHNQPGLQYKDIVILLTKPIREQCNTLNNKSHHNNSSNNFESPMGNSSSNLAVHKQAFYSIAKCIAALTVLNQQEGNSVINQFINDIKDPKSRDSARLLALLCLGETGKYVELSSHAELELVILDSFLSPIEEVKSAASYALGYLSLGNLQKYIPFILYEIDTNSKRQYLLFNSLKEIISYQSSNPNGYQTIKPFITNIWNTLIKHCECSEEGTRNVVAECLGKLTLLDPETLMNNLQSYLECASSLSRSTVVTAIKFTITDQPQAIDGLLKNCLGKFLNALQDNDINVRRVALVTFNSAAHNKPSLVRDLLLPTNVINGSSSQTNGHTHQQPSTLIQHLYNETKIRKELIREVEMGPFKHTVDDGLDLRKAAFECMYTLLDSCLDRIDIFDFLNHVEDGLKDHYDIKMLTYLMLVRLSTLCPNALLQRLDRLIDPLKNTCLQKVKSNAVKQEYEKNDELKRSALRALVALLNIPDAEKNGLMRDFITNIRTTPELAGMFELIQRDAKDAVMDTNMSMDTN
jgi:cullin-associated NEDD8-dissociated protein 1